MPWRSYKAMLEDSAEELFNENRGSIEASTAAEFWTALLRRGGWWDESAKGPSQMRPRNGLLREILDLPTQPAFAGFAGDSTLHLVPFSHNTLQDGDNAHLPWLQATPDPVSSITWQTWVELNGHHCRPLWNSRGRHSPHRVLTGVHQGGCLCQSRDPAGCCSGTVRGRA